MANLRNTMDMRPLCIDNINAKSPYIVELSTVSHSYFYFHTDYEVDYEISFNADSSIVVSGAFTLDITNRGKSTPGDPKVRLTLVAIIEEFFRCNNDVMLYVTETGDDKQEMRHRLFLRWFNTYPSRNSFFIHTAEGLLEGQKNFLALFSRKDNPHLTQAIEEFDETVALLFD